MTTLRKPVSCAIALCLVLSYPIGAAGESPEGPRCRSELPAAGHDALAPAERIELDVPLEEILTDPTRVGKPGSLHGTEARDVETSGRWLPGYRPNTVEAWREFEAWKDERRRNLAARGVAVPAGVAGPTSKAAAGDAGPGRGDDDFPVAARRGSRYPASTVDLRELPPGLSSFDSGRVEERVESADPKTGLPWDVYIRLKEDARFAPETPGVQSAEALSSRAAGFLTGSFDAISSDGTVPPDPIMTVGPTHLVALVNQRYRVWDKNGSPLIDEVPLAAFFNGVADCDSPFDVFVDYDEENDRYVMGGMNISGVDTHLCLAATSTNDPATLWNLYSFRADELLPGTGIDYPHMAIGLDAVYIGGNMFDDGTGAYDSSRIFAVDKTAMYNGTAIQVAEFGVSSYRTPQPARIRGFNTGQWPAPGTAHSILTQEEGSSSVRVYRWADPFVSNPAVHGDVVTTYLGVPPNAPESGDTMSSNNFNDTAGGPLLDAEYRDGSVWSTRTVMCNVGGGNAEACIDWLQIDVSGPSPVLLDQQAGGAFGSVDEFRYYPDLAVDRNGNMAIAFTKSGFSSFTEIWATGREAGDPAGTLRNEVQQVAGQGNYTDGAGCAGTCDRWGDYTGMATDPDGCRFWYIGEYSDGGVGAWKTNIGSYKFDGCSIDSAVHSDRGTYSCRDTMDVVVRDGIPIDAATAAAQTVITSSTDSETIAAEKWIGTECSGSTCVTWTAALALDTVAGANDDGTLQVANGETFTIDYTDPHGGHANQTRQVQTTCQTRLEDGGYVIQGGCEGGTGGEVYRDYIDAGEYVQYVYGVFNPHAAPDLTDLHATLSISGPLAGQITVGNPTVHLGTVNSGQLAGAVFDVYVDPAAAASGISENDFVLTLSSPADGFDVPQVLTQTQVLQADDVVVTESVCFNAESDEGWQSSTYVESYVCTQAPCGAGGVTVNSVAAPWGRGPGCGSETRDDYPEMSCDVNGTFAYTLNDSSVSCNVFAQDFTEFTSDVLYSPIITPANTGNAANGQPWFYAWQYAEWFFRADVSVADPTNPSIAAAHFWSDDYSGGATPGTNDINGFPIWQGNFWSPFNQDWDSATPWDAQNPPANYFGQGLFGVVGLAMPGLQWRWAIWQRDWDAFLGRAPIVAGATAGMAYDDLNMVYEQFHAEAQTTACGAGDVAGRVSFDRLSYAECGSGTLDVSVLDGNAAGPVRVTVTSVGTGDSEPIVLSGTAPRWAATLPYAMDGGVSPDDGVLFVTPSDTVTVEYADANPSATVSAVATVQCSEQAVVVEAVAAIDDSGNAGDADGIPDTNEIVDFSLTLRNDGALALDNVEATIWTDDPDIECVTKERASFGTLAGGGGTGSNSLVSDPFTFKVADGVECVDASNPPTATFHVFISADGMDGAAQPQLFSFELDLDDLGSTLELIENFDGSQPAGWSHAVGPGDDDGVVGTGAGGLACGPYNDDWFWSASGGNGGGGGFFCWQNPLDPFPSGTYSDNLDAVLDSAVVTIPAQGTGATVTFDHEHKLADAGASNGGVFALDGAVVQYNVNGGAWMKVTDLAYDANLFFNTYCNPLCGGGDELSDGSPPSTQDCFHEDPGAGERVFNALDNQTRNWTTVSGNVKGLASGDQLRFRWRVGSMNTNGLGLSTVGGYGLDNVRVQANRFACDATVRPDVGCGLVFDGAGNLTEVCGNGNGLVDSNELWDVDVSLKNLGAGAAVAATADLEVGVGSVVQATVTGNPGAFGTIPQGGSASVTYRFEVEAAPVCAADITFDLTNIADSSEAYPDQDTALAVQVGGFGSDETGLQQTNPASGSGSTDSASFTPAFAQAGPVDVATVSYSFSWDGGDLAESALQAIDPLVATNGDALSALSPGFVLPAGQATSAVVDWTSLTSPGESATACTAVFLETPNSTRITLKALGVAASPPYDVLPTYQTYGPGSYSIVVNERSGGGCNSDGILEGVSMAIDGAIAGDWTSSARVSLVNGASSTVLKDFGQADANPYDVRAIYDSFGPGTYEIRLEENAGGTAEVRSASMTVQSYACAGACSGLPAPPPVADGVHGGAMTAAKGLGPDDVDIAFDTGTCSSDRAVVVYGNLGDYSGYQGAVASGCDAGASGSAGFSQPGSYWFMLVWVNADGTAGPAGNATAGPRTWNAAGLCGVTADDHADQVCN